MMMTNPWNDIDKAFAPMFTETVSVSGKRKDNKSFKTNVEVCIFTDNTSDVISDSALDSDSESILVSFKRDDWQFVNSLKRGDVIERVEWPDSKYVVQDVLKDMVMGYVVKAKLIK